MNCPNSSKPFIQSGLVSGYKRISARDSRVCLACLGAEGRIYELDESFEEHPSGHCTLVPIVRGFPEVTWQSGQDWFMSLSPESQETILGKGRFAAWQDGAFELDQLISRRENDIWGASLIPSPLEELSQ